MQDAAAQLVVTSTVNALSILATLFVIISYLIFKRHYPMAMGRSTLLISFCMAVADLISACFNLVGFSSTLPKSACAVIGGFFFAVPLLCSTFYACSVALNCLLVFVLRVKQSRWLTNLYFFGPPAAAILIGVGALAGGAYGYDEQWGSCWYKTENVSPSLLLARELTTWTLPLVFAFAFLLGSIGCIFYTIIHQSLSSNASQPGTSLSDGQPVANEAANRDRRHRARRGLLFRLVAYIFIPLLTTFPFLILDFLVSAETTYPFSIDIFAFGLASAVGLFNAIVYCLDPTILAIFEMIRQGDFRKPGQTENHMTHRCNVMGASSSAQMSIDDGDEIHALERVGSGRKYQSSLLPFGKSRVEKDSSPKLVVFVQVSTESDTVDKLARDLHDL